MVFLAALSISVILTVAFDTKSKGILAAITWTALSTWMFL